MSVYVPSHVPPPPPATVLIAPPPVHTLHKL